MAGSTNSNLKTLNPHPGGIYSLYTTKNVTNTNPITNNVKALGLIIIFTTDESADYLLDYLSNHLVYKLFNTFNPHVQEAETRLNLVSCA